MRLITAGSTAAVAFFLGAGLTMAADVPAAKVYKAPLKAAPAMPDWTGVYFGINAGYAWARSNWGLSTPLSAITPFRSDSLQPDSSIGGVQIGWNWQSGPWLWGIEGDIDYRNGNDSASIAIPAAGFPTEFRNLQSRETWLGTIRPRVGGVWSSTLLYVTGGLAAGQVTNTQSLVTTTASSTFSASSTRTGWVLGAGLEYVLNTNWTAKLEYLYVDLGNSSLDTPAFTPPGQAGFVASSGVFENRSQIVRAGLNYKLDSARPLIAKY